MHFIANLVTLDNTNSVNTFYRNTGTFYLILFPCIKFKLQVIFHSLLHKFPKSKKYSIQFLTLSGKQTTASSLIAIYTLFRHTNQTAFNIQHVHKNKKGETIFSARIRVYVYIFFFVVRVCICRTFQYVY